MRVAPGAEQVFEAVFTDSAGNPLNPETVHVDIWNAQNVQVVNNATPENISLGVYQYLYAVPVDAPTGMWRIEWQAIVNGLNAFGDEVFEVEFAPVVQPSDQVAHSRLRSRLGETSRLPIEEGGSDTMFSNNDIADLLVYAGNDLDAATYEGWKRKTAHLQRLIDISESGSDRNLSQRFRQAKSMLDFWGGMLAAQASEVGAALSGRVVGRVVNLREEYDPNPGTPFSGYSEHIRAYPTHRLLIPAIMG